MQSAEERTGEPGWLDLAGFQNAVTSSFVPLRVTAPQPASFRGSISQTVVAGVSFTTVVAAPHKVERTPELIRNSPRQFFKVSLQMEGTSRLEQGGRSVDLEPSDLAIYDTNTPYILTFDVPFKVVVIQLPHERFEVPPQLMSRVTAVRLSGQDGLARLVSPFLATLGTDHDHIKGAAGTRLAQNAIDLLGLLFANEVDAAKAASDPHWALFHQIRDHIDENLGDPGLSPVSIAEANYISTRHLHNVFREKGTTVSSYIRSRRLEKCYLDLTSPVRLDVPIAVVGNRWGFVDAAHFSRVFKATYGESPRGIRERIARS